MDANFCMKRKCFQSVNQMFTDSNLNQINIKIHFKTLILTCSSSVEESCRCDPVEGIRFIGFSCCWLLPKLLVICLGGGLGGTGLPEKHSDMWM